MKQRTLLIVGIVAIIVLLILALSPAILTALVQLNGDCIKGWEFCH